jgi:murein DD-endopeptidase MepM/ murein hydrolase activator NlpD
MPQLPMNESYAQNEDSLMKKFTGGISKLASAMPRRQKTNTNVMPQSSGTKGRADINAIYPGLSKLGAVTTPYGGSTKFEQFHPGIDIANKMGTPIPAITGGTVTEVVGGKKQGDKGFGNTVVVQDAQGNKYRYSHLHQQYVKVGQKVSPGMQIGTMGNTGSTYSTSGGDGTHLDLRIYDAFNKYMNPSQYLNT